MTLHGEQTIVGIKKILPEMRSLAGATITNGSASGFTNGTLVADEFNGGFMQILDGNQAGRVYKILDNGTHSVTVDRPTLLESGNAVNANDRVALFPWRRRAEETITWILCDEVRGLTPTKEYDEYFAQTRTGEPYRTDAVEIKTTIQGSIEFTPQNAYMFPLIFGYETDTGTSASGLSTTLNGAAYAGETTIAVDVITNGTADDYIRVGGAADGEIRKISSINGSTITLDKPLRRYHADNGTVLEVTSPYTHTFKLYYGNVYRMWPFELILQHTTEGAGEGTLTQFIKLICSGYRIYNDGDKLKVSMDVVGYYYDYDNDTPVTAPTEVDGDILLYKNSEVSVNSTVDGKIRTVSVTGNYGAEAKWYHSTFNDTYPNDVTFGRMTDQEVTLGVRIEDDKFLALLDGGTEFDAYAKYSWNGTEYLQLNFNDCFPKSLPVDIPPGGPIETEFTFTPEYLTVTVVDTTPYW